MAAEVLATLAYRHAFFDGDVGQAAAACVMAFGLCATAVYLRSRATTTDNRHDRGSLEQNVQPRC